MFDSRVKRFLSVILSSCILGCLSSFLTCQSADIGVSVNKGNQVGSGVSGSFTEGAVLSQTNDGDMAVISGGSSSISFLDGYILKGNVINYGENLHLVTYDSVPPLNCDLYVRAVKVKDGFGNDIAYDPDTSNTSLDSGWLKYEGRATFDHLASTTGLWHTFTVRYKGEDFKNDYGAKYVVLDQSRSTDGINRYTLLDKDRNVLVPSLLDTDESASDSTSIKSPESEVADNNSEEESTEESDVSESESTEESPGN